MHIYIYTFIYIYILRSIKIIVSGEMSTGQDMGPAFFMAGVVLGSSLKKGTQPSFMGTLTQPQCWKIGRCWKDVFFQMGSQRPEDNSEDIRL